MKPPEEVKRELIEQWIAKAEEDLKAAQLILSQEPALRSLIGFHAQQTAEKYLKAFLSRHQIEFPKTHNLGELLDLIAQVDPSLAGSLCDVTALNPYGVDVRYPSDFPAMTPGDAREAVELAGKVREAILTALKEQV